MKKWYNKLFLNDLRRAVDDYSLIQSGDKILVGLSGGKDSIFLLYALDLLKKRSYLNFDLMACHIDIGIKIDMSSIENYCQENNIEFINKSLDIRDKIFEGNQSPCYICSKYKRGAMAGVAKNFSANKIAYGHHLTDFADTFILNLVKENSLRSFKALTYNEKHEISLIRPLIYIEEDIIQKVVLDENLPMGKGELCPYDDKNERNKVNEIITFAKTIYPDFEKSILKTVKKLPR